jgi:hypothetical protein
MKLELPTIIAAIVIPGLLIRDLCDEVAECQDEKVDGVWQ